MTRDIEVADALLTLARAWRHMCPAAKDTTLSRLELVLDRAGYSQSEAAAIHETDPEAGWADEVFRWYDTEHMPGLAQVLLHSRPAAAEP